MKSRFVGSLLALLLLSGIAEAGEIKPFQRGSWRDIQAAHRGKTLVAHFWSLSCAPCLAEMPRWAEFRRNNPEKTLVLIATDPAEKAPRLKEALARFGLAEADAWAFADPFAERLRFEVDPEWRGELPMTRLIASDGRAETVIGAFSPSP